MQMQNYVPVAGSLVLLMFLSCVGRGADCPPGAEAQTTVSKRLEMEWGIQVESLRLSAKGYMIDFRCKVLDPIKAAALARRENKPYLIDEASGAKFLVPNTPKVGPMRPKAQNLAAGRTYWMLFSNPGKYVQAGSTVTIVIGDIRVEHLKIQG